MYKIVVLQVFVTKVLPNGLTKFYIYFCVYSIGLKIVRKLFFISPYGKTAFAVSAGFDVPMYKYLLLFRER